MNLAPLAMLLLFLINCSTISNTSAPKVAKKGSGSNGASYEKKYTELLKVQNSNYEKLKQLELKLEDMRRLHATERRSIDGVGYLNFDRFLGASIVAEDGTYLGKISRSKYESNSILNNYGSHGGKYSSHSIFNKYGSYGGKYSSYSPFNKYSSSPPKIVKNGRVLGLLTVNKHLTGAVNPFSLIGFLKTD